MREVYVGCLHYIWQKIVDLGLLVMVAIVATAGVDAVEEIGFSSAILVFLFVHGPLDMERERIRRTVNVSARARRAS